MKIVALTAENIKKLTAVHIEPNGNLVQITGKNGQGKTSVLDSIWWALDGAANIQRMPIRKGATTAQIKMRLKSPDRELIITRTFKRKGEDEYTTAISVETPDGAKFGSAQKLLAELLGELTFDPLAFARMKPKEQFDALRSFVPGFDFEKQAALRQADYDRRQDINREEKRERAAGEAIRVPDGTPAERVDEEALLDALGAAATKNADIQTRTHNRAAANSKIEQLRAEAAATTAEADRLEEQLRKAEPLPPLVDIADLQRQVADARRTNEQVAALERRVAFLRRADDLAKQSEALTAQMAERDEAKAAAIHKATLPVDGLGFGDGFITFNGVPFNQASDAQQLRASAAIAMSGNPGLRVIRIRDGSLLDEDGLRILAEMAEARDFQVWIERVDSSGTVGFVLEDGHLKGAQATDAAA